jgi:hypothetical protein
MRTITGDFNKIVADGYTYVRVEAVLVEVAAAMQKTTRAGFRPGEVEDVVREALKAVKEKQA